MAMLQQCQHVGVFTHGGREFDDQRRLDALEAGAQRRQRGDGRAQAGEVARPRAAQRHAREDALHVADGAQRLTQGLEAPRID